MAPFSPSAYCRSHDYRFLLARWKKIAKITRLDISTIDQSSGYDRIFLSPRRPDPLKPWIYFSTGIHGDESAATEGLLAWITGSPQLLKRFNALIFPCLNPWGLVNNSRLDMKGRDLNRCYRKGRGPATPHLRILAGRRFALALTLHEDYDAQGVYIYEVAGRSASWGRDLLESVSRIIPVDPRRTIEGKRVANGLIRRDPKPGEVEIFPEALYLHFHHSDHTFTFETPSELQIDTRVAAQVRLIDHSVRRAISG